MNNAIKRLEALIKKTEDDADAYAKAMDYYVSNDKMLAKMEALHQEKISVILAYYRAIDIIKEEAKNDLQSNI